MLLRSVSSFNILYLCATDQSFTTKTTFWASCNFSIFFLTIWLKKHAIHTTDHKLFLNSLTARVKISFARLFSSGFGWLYVALLQKTTLQTLLQNFVSLCGHFLLLAILFRSVKSKILGIYLLDLFMLSILFRLGLDNLGIIRHMRIIYDCLVRNDSALWIIKHCPNSCLLLRSIDFRTRRL